jgi:hypothetical protein
MGLSHSPKISTSGLVCLYDNKNPKSSTGTSTMSDISGVTNITLSGNSMAASSGLTWANNITNITISILLEKVTTTTEYAYHPINKWGASLGVASFVLYHFGNYLGNGADGQLAWYAGANGGWTYMGGHGTMVTGNIWNLVFQYNSSTGSKLWTNGTIVSTGSGGTLGQGGSSSDIGIYGPDTNVTSKVHQLMFYNRELSDTEIVNNYNAIYKSRIRT